MRLYPVRYATWRRTAVRALALSPMAPKAKSAAVLVDGVQCSVDLKSRVVTVGSGLVGNEERDRFRVMIDSNN